MLNFDEREEARMEQEAFALSTEQEAEQVIYISAFEFAKAAQHKALLMALRSAVSGEGYGLEKVARHVVATFNELEGAGC